MTTRRDRPFGSANRFMGFIIQVEPPREFRSGISGRDPI
jgi:hypothetical protein